MKKAEDIEEERQKEKQKSMIYNGQYLSPESIGIFIWGLELSDMYFQIFLAGIHYVSMITKTIFTEVVFGQSFETIF